MPTSKLVAATLIAALVASGCAIRPYQPRNPSQPESQTSPTNSAQTQPAPPPETPGSAQPLPSSPTPAPRPKTLSAASKALVAQAQSQSAAGNDSLAAATIERALRIDSDSPLLWIELAKIRQNEGNAPQAENLARKALSMATGDNKTQAVAWRLIAESLRARGRNPEAREADAKANALGGSG